MTSRILAKLSLACFGALVASSAYAQVDLVADEAYASDSRGEAMIPMTGDDFYVSLRYRVTGPLKTTYTIRIETPYRRMDTTTLGFGIDAPGEYTVTWGPIPALTERAIPVKATLIPGKRLRETNTKNNVASFSLTAGKPETGIEYYAAQALYGDLSVRLAWSTRAQAPGTLSVWLPNATTESFQEVGATVLPEGMAQRRTDNPFAAIVGPMEATNFTFDVAQRFETTASSQRTNLDVLRSVGFESMIGLDLDQWLRPESLIQSAHPDIVALSNASRANIATDSIVDVAEALYLAVLKRMSYTSKSAVPSAYAALKAKKGDCGGMSSAFVALCRAQGIAARPVTGFTLGNNQWHVWAEFFVPGHGWVAVDPAYADTALPSGELPLYFGVMPRLNERLATNFGFEKTDGERVVSYLQAPTIFWPNPKAKLTTSSSRCSLSTTPAP